jgi:hypothetical protein
MNALPYGLFLGLALTLSPGMRVAGESVVRTTAGTMIRGLANWEPSGITVTPSAGDPVRVPLEEVSELTLDDSDSNATGENPTESAVRPASGAAAGGLPPGWVGAQVGVGKAGTIGEDAEGWSVNGGGLGLIGNADSFFFAHQRLEASGQLIARLDSFQGTNSEAMAGIVLRDNLGESAAYAFVGFRGGSGLCFQYRQIASGMTMRTTNMAVGMPAWLRLTRSGGAVSADVSPDGRQWQNLSKGNVNLGQSVRAGMVVAAGSAEGMVTARFRDPMVGARGIGYAPGSGYPKVILRGGSVLIAPVVSADESVLRLGGSLAGAVVSAMNLARIEYAPLTPELRERAEDDRRGVLLVDGDFMDGALRSIATNTVTVSSLLYGFRSFAVGSEAAWVQAGTVEAEEAPYRIALRNGSELRARQVELGTNTVRAESPLLGSMLLKREVIRSIRHSATAR